MKHLLSLLTLGMVLTSPPLLALGPEIAPIANSTIRPGFTATFSANVTGLLPLTYAWQHNGSVIVDDGHFSGATTPTLTVANVDIPDRRLFTLTVTDALGLTNSSSAHLFVIINTNKPNDVADLLVYEPFEYPTGPLPAINIHSWENLVNIYNRSTGQPVYWSPVSTINALNSAVTANDLTRWDSVSRQPQGTYPWPGIDCSGHNMWKWDGRTNDNRLKFGGVTNGSTYFSFVFHVDQDSNLQQGTFDTIAGFTSGESVIDGANADTWNLKICTQADGPNNDGYHLGVFKGGGSMISDLSINGQWAPEHLLRGQIHFVVGCYKINSGNPLRLDDVVSLWIDPNISTFGAAEGNVPVPNAGGMVTNWNFNAPITEFGIRGSTYPMTKRMADLRIGTTWASVTKLYYPTLKQELASPNFKLSWPAKDSFSAFGDSGYKLQIATEVVGPYLDDGNVPTLNGTNIVVTETPGTPQFWRLYYPARSGTYGQF